MLGCPACGLSVVWFVSFKRITTGPNKVNCKSYKLVDGHNFEFNVRPVKTLTSRLKQRIHRYQLVPIVVILLLTAGCSTVVPTDAPDEFAMQPADSQLWQKIAEQRQEDWFHLLNTGPEAMEWRLRAIDSAVSSIDLQTFLWMWDESGSVVLRHLLQAADRGVRVRLLVDDMFLNAHADIVWDLAHHQNVEFRIYNPFGRRPESLALRQILNLGEFHRLDHRMHNKAMIVDNRVAVIGGRNLADEYFGLHSKANFRDMEVLVGGGPVGPMSEMFDTFWNNRWSIPLDAVIKRPPSGMDLEAFSQWIYEEVEPGLRESAATRLDNWLALVQDAAGGEAILIADHPARDNPADHEQLPNQLAVELRAWLDRAQSEITLISAYLIPTPELEETIEQAVQRGVRVRILTNSLRSNNHTAAHSAYRHHINRLLSHGAYLHEVQAFAKDRHLYMQDPVSEKELGLHAKLILIDKHLTFIGSANLDPRSLHLNTEMGLMIDSGEFNGQVRSVLEQDFFLRNAWELELEEDGSPAWRSDDGVLRVQPADGALHRLEDWFLGIMPIEAEM